MHQQCKPSFGSAPVECNLTSDCKIMVSPKVESLSKALGSHDKHMIGTAPMGDAYLHTASGPERLRWLSW
jgi:hypothetical protein